MEQLYHGKILDFTKWKTADGLFNNVEDEIGRMYRYFINDGFVKKLNFNITEKPVEIIN